MLESFEGVKPGTKLLIRSDLSINMHPMPKFGVNTEMAKCAGQIVTVEMVEGLDRLVRLEEYGFNWSPNMFEAIVKNKEFKDIPLASYLFGGE